jgi:DNA ligase-1
MATMRDRGARNTCALSRAQGCSAVGSEIRARAYSGLSDDEIAALDRWIRQHTVGRCRPVRVVEPTLVFERQFEALALSTRHRSGIAVRFPRTARQRIDKRAEDADSLEQMRELMDGASRD